MLYYGVKIDAGNFESHGYSLEDDRIQFDRKHWRTNVFRSIICINLCLLIAGSLVTKAFAQVGDFKPGVVKNPNMNEEAVVLLLLDEGKGNRATDSSELRNHGELKGGAAWKQGKFGMAVELGPGSPGFRRIEIAPHDSHALHTMTIMAWVNLNGKIGNDSFIIDKSCWDCAAELPRNFSLWDHSNPRNLLFGWRQNGNLGGAGDVVVGTPPTEGGKDEIHDGTWHHVGGTYDGKDMRAYIDGDEKGVNNFPSKPGDARAPAYLNAPIVIGALGPDGRGFGFPRGTLIDEVAILSYALDGKEIEQAMENGLAWTFVLAVNPMDKLAITWAKLKQQ